uniref:Lipocalin/cytosolic fatty-acid binding domain-containing protein n=1 Tax=Macaca mulatta TaxID=9544 RepID=A0A5F7ZAK2_MACMU
MKVIPEKTDKPGKYTADSGKHVTYIIRSHVKDHYIFYCEGELHGKPIRGVKLVETPRTTWKLWRTLRRPREPADLARRVSSSSRQSGRRHSPAEPPVSLRGDISRAALHGRVTVLRLILALSFLGWWSWWLMRGPGPDCIPGGLLTCLCFLLLQKPALQGVIRVSEQL